VRAEIKIFETANDLAGALATEFERTVNQASILNQNLFVALSGGSTPAFFFRALTKPPFQKKISWNHVHLFWIDERCVSPDHPESNYGMTRNHLLNHIFIPEKNIHRIRGEADPFEEAKRYADEIETAVSKDESNLPRFDWIFLGLGADGHTASIFPGSGILEENKSICSVAAHPVTKQRRITLTLPAINNAKRISFLVTGKSKAVIVAEIVNKGNNERILPAAFVHPSNGMLEWYLDREAGVFLKIDSENFQRQN